MGIIIGLSSCKIIDQTPPIQQLYAEHNYWFLSPELPKQNDIRYYVDYNNISKFRPRLHVKPLFTCQYYCDDGTLIENAETDYLELPTDVKYGAYSYEVQNEIYKKYKFDYYKVYLRNGEDRMPVETKEVIDFYDFFDIYIQNKEPYIYKNVIQYGKTIHYYDNYACFIIGDRMLVGDYGKIKIEIETDNIMDEEPAYIFATADIWYKWDSDVEKYLISSDGETFRTTPFYYD